MPPRLQDDSAPGSTPIEFFRFIVAPNDDLAPTVVINPDGFSAVNAAVIKNTQFFTNVWTNPNGVDDGSNMLVQIQRQICCAFRIFTRNPNGCMSNAYQWADAYGSTQFVSPAYSGTLEIIPARANPYLPVTDLSLHTNVLFGARDTQKKRYLWHDADGSPTSFIYVTANIALSGVTPVGGLQVFRCNGRTSAQPTFYPFTAFATAGGMSQLMIPITQNGFHRVAVVNPSASAISFNFVSSCFGNAFWQQIPAQSFGANIGAYLGVALDAVSLQWSNRGPALYTNGSLLGARYGESADVTYWLSTAVANPNQVYDYVSNQAKNKDASMSNGAYTFLVPADLEAFEYRSPVSALDPTATTWDGDYPILNEDPWQLLVAQISPTTGSNSDTTSTTMTCGTAARTQSNAQTLTTDPAPDNSDLVKTALTATKTMPVFYNTNRFSLDQIETPTLV